MDGGTLTTALGVKKLTESIWAEISKSAQSRWKNLRNEQALGKLSARLNALRLVRTIWEPDRPVDLCTFYVPGHLETADGRRIIDRIDQLPTGNVTVRGTVGLGKSLLLRWFAWREVGFGERVPIFVELRKVSPNRSLTNLILAEMEALGLYAEIDLLKTLAARGKVVLLLDGFDEISRDMESAVVADLEMLARAYSKLKIIVSTRPESPACHLSGFTVTSMSHLEDDEYKLVLRKIEPDQDNVSRILDSLSIANSTVEPLLSTPLMVALLVVKFRVEYEVPENERAFYDGLFDLLVRKHDRTKGGFSRQRKSGFSNQELSDAFDAFSYFTRRDKMGAFSRREALNIAQKSLQRTVGGTASEQFLDDIVEISCLVLF